MGTHAYADKRDVIGKTCGSSTRIGEMSLCTGFKSSTNLPRTVKVFADLPPSAKKLTALGKFVEVCVTMPRSNVY